MAYRHSNKSIREVYEEHFSGMDSRDMGNRVVNIVEKRHLVPRQGMDYDPGFEEDQWYDGPQNYQDARDFHGEGSYPHNDRFNGRYYDDNPNFGFPRNSSPPQNEGLYGQQNFGRDDLRHQLDSRKNVRGHPHFRGRGRGGARARRQKPDKKNRGDHDNFGNRPPVGTGRDRSPGRREAQPPAMRRSGSNTSTRSFSPDKDKGYSYQQAQQRQKANVTHQPTSSSVDESPHSSGSSKEKTPASAAESEEAAAAAAAASMEPKPTPEEDANTRRLEAIKSKALDIEKHYRQDCETFRTVVNMLVAKEPSLGKVLEAPLDDNLSEMKQRCLDALRHFVKELDGVSEQPNASQNAAGIKTQE